MEGKPQNRLQEVQCNEIKMPNPSLCPFPSLCPLLVGLHRQEEIPQKGQIRKIGEVLLEIH